MSDNYAYEGGVPGRREPTHEESARLFRLTFAQIKIFGIEHLLRIHEAIVDVAMAADRDSGELHADCFGKLDASGKGVGFVYIGTEHMDTMALRDDTQEHIAKLHAQHAEAKRSQEAKRPKEN